MRCSGNFKGWMSAIVISIWLSPAQAQDVQPPVPGLTPEIVAAAATYQDWVDRMSAHQGVFLGGPDVASSLTASARWEPHQFQAGMVAWGAMVALRDPEFVTAVRAAPLEQVLAVRESPANVFQLFGALSAGRRVAKAFGQQSEDLGAAGTRLTAAAYSIQHQPWSLQIVDTPEARLAAVKRLSAEPVAASDAMINSTMTETAASTAADPAAAFAASGIMTKSLALAALMIINESRSEAAFMDGPFSRDPATDCCLRMVKINLNQCLASAGPHYEDVFCIGKHPVEETASCIRKAAGLPKPVPVSPNSGESAFSPMPVSTDPGH
jgi:hypothetical protein